MPLPLLFNECREIGHYFQAHHNYGERGMKTFLLTAHLDDRHGLGVIRSRIGIQQEATLILNPVTICTSWYARKTKGFVILRFN